MAVVCGQKEKWNRIGICAAVLVTFVIMALLCYFTPYASDDYANMYVKAADGGITEARITSMGQVLTHVWNLYGTFSCRVVANFLTAIFLMLDKNVYNICNAGIYCVFLLAQYKLIVGKKSASAMIFLAVMTANWFLLAVFPIATLWITGSCVYLWGTTLVLLFMLPLRTAMENDAHKGILFCVGFTILGLLAGLTYENFAGVGLLFAAATIGVRKHRKKKIPAWILCGTAANLIGIVLLVTGGGTAGRIATTAGDASALSRYFLQLQRCIVSLKELCMVPLIGAVVVLILLYDRKLEKRELYHGYFPVVLFVFLAMANNFVMLLSPTYPNRATIGVNVMLFIACGIGIRTILERNPKWKQCAAAVVAACVLLWMSTSFDALVGGKALYVDEQTWQAEVRQQKESGTDEVVLDISFGDWPGTRWNCWCKYDFTTKKSTGFDRKAAIYGVDSIVWKEMPYTSEPDQPSM